MVAITGMAVGGTVGEAGVAGAATAVSAGPVVVVKDAPAGGNVQSACGHSVPCWSPVRLIRYCSGSPTRIVGSWGSLVTPSIKTMEPTSMAGMALPRTQSSSGSTHMLPLTHSRCTTFQPGSQTSESELFSASGTLSARWSSKQSSYAASGESIGSTTSSQSFGVGWTPGKQVDMWLW
jgi:hypothetical protein